MKFTGRGATRSSEDPRPRTSRRGGAGPSAPVEGPLRVDRRTAALLGRLRPGDVAVLDQPGDVGSYAMGLRPEVAGRQRDQRAFRLDHVVQPLVRDLVAAGWSRHGGVDLRHDHLGAVQDRRHEMH